MGQQLLDRCLQAALAFGFERCYLETLSGMDRARALYQRNGFELLEGPLGNTGHFGCNLWYLKSLAHPVAP
jgi:putative acetyltransferase